MHFMELRQPRGGGDYRIALAATTAVVASNNQCRLRDRQLVPGIAALCRILLPCGGMEGQDGSLKTDP